MLDPFKELNMSEYLETLVDKFIFIVANDLFYNPEGVWAKPEGKHVRIGLSDFLQQRSGDVAFAEVKPPGTVVAVGDEVAVIETIKVNISLTSPVSGKVVEMQVDSSALDPTQIVTSCQRRKGKAE